MKARWSSNTGNSMLEVLMAMVIAGIAATAATGGMVSTTNLMGENTMYHNAIVLAQQSLERTRTISYEDIENTTTTSAPYTITKTVADDTPDIGMKQITVAVSWTWKGKPRSYLLKTVFGELTKS